MLNAVTLLGLLIAAALAAPRRGLVRVRLGRL